MLIIAVIALAAIGGFLLGRRGRAAELAAMRRNTMTSTLHTLANSADELERLAEQLAADNTHYQKRRKLIH